jgi:shikimate kinase
MIVICGLNDKLNFQVGKMLSDSLDMFFLDLEKFIEYDVVNKEDIIEKVSLEYLSELEKKSVKHVASFENTVIAASYNCFVINKNYDYFKNKSIIIYLRQTKSQIENSQSGLLNKVNFVSRDKKLKLIADYVITLENNNVVEGYNKIIQQLKEVFL